MVEAQNFYNKAKQELDNTLNSSIINSSKQQVILSKNNNQNKKIYLKLESEILVEKNAWRDTFNNCICDIL